MALSSRDGSTCDELPTLLRATASQWRELSGPAVDGSTSDELPPRSPPLDFPRMKAGELRVNIQQVAATASQWSTRSTELSVLAPPPLGQPFQPTTVAVGGAHAAVGLAAAAFTARTRATASAVEAGAAEYANNEAVAAAEMATVPQTRLV